MPCILLWSWSEPVAGQYLEFLLAARWVMQSPSLKTALAQP
jgi:hypothetical protein